MSFIKVKKDSSLSIPGLRTSSGNSQVCSTGSNSLDFVLGGGIEMNSIILIGKQTIFLIKFILI
jgi:predicted ATP-dependent serine protease